MGSPVDGSVVVVVPGGGSDGTPPVATDPAAGVAAVAALEQASENAITVEALRTLVERITERFALEMAAITERVDALSEILMSAMEDLDLEAEIPEEEEIEEEVAPEEAVIELSDTAGTANPNEETPEASQRDSDVAGRDGNESGESGSDSGANASERAEHRSAPKPKQRSGPFGRR